jgi:hypothetical protein
MATTVDPFSRVIVAKEVVDIAKKMWRLVSVVTVHETPYRHPIVE